VSGRVKHVHQVDDARIGGAQRHERNFVQYLRRAVLSVAHLGGIFGGEFDSGSPVATFAYSGEQPAAKRKAKVNEDICREQPNVNFVNTFSNANVPIV
jgi:hypothetical protein